MFTLIKIQNSGSNVPEPCRIALSTAVTAAYGTPVSVRGGTATVLSATTTLLATHLVMANTEGKSLLAARITPDMVFEVSVNADPSAMKVGTEYALTADGLSLSATAVSGSVRGAVLVDASHAKAAGDKVLVRFPA